MLGLSCTLECGSRCMVESVLDWFETIRFALFIHSKNIRGQCLLYCMLQFGIGGQQDQETDE